MARDVIFSLQVGRGLAALAVVAHHATVSTAAFVETVPDTFLRFFDLGIYGVDFFSCCRVLSSCIRKCMKPGVRLRFESI